MLVWLVYLGPGPGRDEVLVAALELGEVAADRVEAAARPLQLGPQRRLAGVGGVEGGQQGPVPGGGGLLGAEEEEEGGGQAEQEQHRPPHRAARPPTAALQIRISLTGS